MPSLFRIHIHGGIRSLMNAYCRLSERRDEATFIERHLPYSQFRDRVSRLEDRAKGLLKDTMVSS
jgi:hypothetical protein